VTALVTAEPSEILGTDASHFESDAGDDGGKITTMPRRSAWADTLDDDSGDDAVVAIDLLPLTKQQKSAVKRSRQRKAKLVNPPARPSEFEQLEGFMLRDTDVRSISSLYVSLLEIELCAKQCRHDINILGCDCHQPGQLAQYEVMLCSEGISTICQACSDYY
jgi:hypothetical protein